MIVNLEDAPFDSLYLQDYALDRTMIIPGKKTAMFSWEITIPDEVVANSELMQLVACPFDPKSNSQRLVRFVAKGARQNGLIVNVGVDDRNNYIFGRYLDTTIIRNTGFNAKVGNKDSVITGNLICENFQLIVKDENSDMAVRSQAPMFSWFMDSGNESNSYEAHLSSYIALARKFPHSRYLMASLANNLNHYKSKEDVEKVYLNFSSKHKNTVFGKKIERFIYETRFPNKDLPTSKKTYQKVVEDSSKYNLIVFIASWCGPCIEEIPLLKKIYRDLGKDLLVTYISIDSRSGVSNFEKLVKINQVPWRTLFAYEHLEEHKRIYFVETIPHSILVYPNQTYQILDLRKEEDRSQLYSLVRSIKN
ncbi:hypothetical protein GCM10027347_55500 [Larkinella harenae]